VSPAGPAAALTRERIVRSATELIEEGGYAAASVAAVAERAGLAAGALYYHFPSKVDLFLEVFRTAGDAELHAMQASAAAEHEDFDARFAAVITTYATSALGNPRLAWALVHEPVDPLLDAERLAWRRRYRNEMAKLLESGIEAGEIDAHDPDFAAAAVVGAIAESLVGPLSPLSGDAYDEAEIVGELVDFCRRALGASKAR
jgi:AcrR family transcriptional regulator